MNKMARRKRQIIRRATAILLSLAMVFSVIYLNNRSEVSLADGLSGDKEISAFTDNTYLKDMDFTVPGAKIVLHSPTDKAGFMLCVPESEDKVKISYQWYTVGDEPAVDTTDNLAITGGTPISALDKDHTQAVLYKLTLGSPAYTPDDDPTTPEDESATPVPAVDAQVDRLSELELSVDALTELSVVVDEAAHTVTVTGEDDFVKADTSTDIYYGSTEFAYEKDVNAAKTSASQVTGWSGSISDLSTHAGQLDPAADGKYVFYKKTELKSSDNKLVYFYAVEKERKFYPAITEAKLEPEGTPAILADDEHKITISDVNPGKNLFFRVETGDNISKIEAVNTTDPTETYTAVDSKTLTINGSPDNNNTQKVFTVTVSSDGKLNVTYTLTITYRDAKPTVEDLAVLVDGVKKEKETDGKVYLGEADISKASIYSKVAAPEGNVPDKASLWEVISGTDTITSTPEVTITNGEATLDVPDDVTPGNHTYKVQALSDGGATTMTDGIKVYYDPTAPSVEQVQIIGKVNGATKTQTVTDGTIADKISSSAEYKIRVVAKDTLDGTSTGSGVVEIKAVVGSETYTTTDMTAPIDLIVPQNSENSGKNITVTVTATDRAGNISETKTLTVPFAEDVLEVKSEITDMASSLKTKETKNIGGEDKEVDVTLTKEGIFNVVYSVKTDIPIKEAFLSVVKDGTETIEPLVPADFTKVSDPTDGDPYYRYTYTRKVSENESTILDSIQMTVTSMNEFTAKDPGQEFIQIDLTSGEVTFLKESQKDAVDNKVWFRSLSLLFRFSEQSVADVPAVGTYQAGFFNDKKKTIKLEKGGEVSSFSLDGVPEDAPDTVRGMSGQFSFTIDQSEDINGTEVSFTLVDAVGNEFEFGPITVYIDKVPPAVDNFIVKSNNKEVSRDMPDKDHYLKGDPTIEFTTKDSIKVAEVKARIIRPDGSDVDITSSLDADWNLQTTKLSDLLGTTPEEGEYQVIVDVSDMVPYTNATSSPVETTLVFEIDNTKPTVDIRYRNPNLISNGMYSKTDPTEIVVVIHDPGLEKHIEELKKVKGNENLKDQITVKDKTTPKLVTNWAYDEREGAVVGTFKVSYDKNSFYNNQHGFRVTVKDLAYNTRTSDELELVIDTKKPVINTMVNGEKYPTTDGIKYFNTNAKVALDIVDDITDPNSLTVNVEYQPYVGAPATSYKDPKPWEKNKVYSEDGIYTIEYRVKDYASNSASKSITFVVDKTAPVNELEIRGADAPLKFNTFKSTYKNKTSGLTYDYAQYFSVDSVRVDYSVVDRFPEEAIVRDTDASGKVLKEIKLTPENLSGYITAETEGAHNIVITSKDKAGNMSVAMSVSFVIDRTAPSLSTSLNGNPFGNSDGVKYLQGGARVGVSVSDANIDEADLTRTVQMTPPGGGTSTTTTNVSTGAQDFQTDADYVITFKAVDRAGNESAESKLSFRVDQKAPELSISGALESGTATKDVTAVYNVFEAFYSDMDHAQVKVYRKVDGESRKLIRTVDIRPTGANSSLSEVIDEDGNYDFEFDAQDKVGNAAHRVFSFLLDKTAPTLVLSGVTNHEKTKSDVELQTVVTEAFYTSNTLTIEGTREDIDGNKENLTFEKPNVNTKKEDSFVNKFTDDGIYDVSVKSKDKAGNESAQDLHFTIDKTAPEIGDLSKYDGVTLNHFVWDIDENKLVRDLTACDVTIYLDGTAYDGVTELADGSHVLRVTAVDEVGNESSKEVTFVLDQIAPNIIVTGIEDQQRIEEPVTVQVTLQIAEDVLDSVTLNGEAQDISNNSATFKVEKAGEYDLEVKAHDAASNENTLKWSFTYGSKFSWLWILAACGGALLLIIILLILRRKSWKQK
ncbi:MAG: hypothetical protein IJM25_10860 [Eubacterium sp.]|nr:hypothetical protein [Eubacterium sp.]